MVNVFNLSWPNMIWNFSLPPQTNLALISVAKAFNKRIMFLQELAPQPFQFLSHRNENVGNWLMINKVRYCIDVSWQTFTKTNQLCNEQQAVWIFDLTFHRKWRGKSGCPRENRIHQTVELKAPDTSSINSLLAGVVVSRVPPPIEPSTLPGPLTDWPSGTASEDPCRTISPAGCVRCPVKWQRCWCWWVGLTTWGTCGRGFAGVPWHQRCHWCYHVGGWVAWSGGSSGDVWG